MKVLTKEQAAYIAGFLEGEGSFYINRSKRKSSSGRFTSIIPRIQTGQQDATPLRYILEVTGVGHISYNPRKSDWRNPSYRHLVTGRRHVISFVKAIYPYLKAPRTRKRARCVYQMAKLLNSPGTNHVTNRKYEARMKIYKTWKTTVRPRRIKGKVK